MRSEGLHEPGEKTAGDRGVLCSACDRLNPPGARDCDRCSRPLFYVCTECGKQNQIVFTRCRKCGHKGQQRWSTKLADGTFGSGFLNPLVILSVLSLVLLIAALGWALKDNAVVRLW